MHGDFEFGAWGGTLGIKGTADEEEIILSDEEWNNGAITMLFIDLLDDKDPSARWTAACGLGKYGRGPWESVAVASLVAAVGDENDDVRTEAAEALVGLRAQLEPAVESVVADIINREREKGPISYGDSSLTDADMEKMRGWTNLRGLSASHTEVGNEGLACLEKLTGLVALRLDGTRVTDSGLVHLSGLRNLDFLDLSETGVTDAGLAHLKGLSGLRMLDLSGTDVTEEGIEDLQRALPGLKIVH